MMHPAHLIPFSSHPDVTGTTLPAGWSIIDGEPQIRTWRQYSSDEAKLISGMWESTPGTYRVSYVAWEFCHILEGRCTLSPDGGEPFEIEAGSAFVIEPGFVGTWAVHETVRKHFVFRLP